MPQRLHKSGEPMFAPWRIAPGFVSSKYKVTIRVAIIWVSVRIRVRHRVTDRVATKWFNVRVRVNYRVRCRLTFRVEVRNSVSVENGQRSNCIVAGACVPQPPSIARQKMPRVQLANTITKNILFNQHLMETSQLDTEIMSRIDN